MLRKPRFKNLPYVGVDVEANSVRVVALQKMKDKYKVKNFALCDIANIKIRSRSKVAVALPYSAVIDKRIYLDKNLKEKEIEQYLNSNLDKHVDVNSDNFNMDFRIVSMAPPSFPRTRESRERLEETSREQYKSDENISYYDSNNKTNTLAGCYVVEDSADLEKQEVEIVVAPKDKVVKKVELLRLMGIKVAIVEEESFALARATQLMLEKIDSYIFVVNLRKSSVLFCLLLRGERVYLKESIEVIDTENKLAELIYHEVKKVLVRICSAISRIIIAGERSTGNLVLEVAKLTGVRTDRANPFRRMVIDKGLDRNVLNNNSHLLFLSCGLASWG